MEKYGRLYYTGSFYVEAVLAAHLLRRTNSATRPATSGFAIKDYFYFFLVGVG
jgi:hypothetical protein